MKVQKLDTVAVDVKNLEEAIKFFSDILGTTFVNMGELKSDDGKPGGLIMEKKVTEYANTTFEKAKVRIAMDRTGFLELIESDPPLKEGLRNIHFKVADIEKAKAEMKRRGVRLIADIRIGGLKEAIFNPDDVHGIRLCFVEYDAPTFVDALLQKKSGK